MLYVAVAITLAPLLFLALIWWITSKFIAPVPKRVTWPANVSVVKQDVSFEARDMVKLKGWFIPAPGSDCAIVLLHAISMTRFDMLNRGLWLHSLGYNVLVYDARGCGESDPVFRSFGRNETQDLLGALDWLQAHGMKRIGCIGFSQGAATIALAADDLPPSVQAIVAEGCYTNLRASADTHVRHWVGPLAPFFQSIVVPVMEFRLGWQMHTLSPLAEMPKIKVPIYFIGGTEDDQSPPEGTEQLDRAAPNAKGLWLVSGARHTDFYMFDPATYRRNVGEFLKANLPVADPEGTAAPQVAK